MTPNFPEVEKELNAFHRKLIEIEILPEEIPIIIKAIGPVVNAVGKDTADRTRCLMHEDITRLGKSVSTTDVSDLWLSGFIAGTIMSAAVIEGGREHLEHILEDKTVEKMRAGMTMLKGLLGPDVTPDKAEELRQALLDLSREKLLSKTQEVT
jgi:hypothetical protein